MEQRTQRYLEGRASTGAYSLRMHIDITAWPTSRIIVAIQTILEFRGATLQMKRQSLSSA